MDKKTEPAVQVIRAPPKWQSTVVWICGGWGRRDEELGDFIENFRYRLKHDGEAAALRYGRKEAALALYYGPVRILFYLLRFFGDDLF